jgi:cyclopropane fatty-acyl-phospholipid synthase-like methyltransferase
VNDPKRLVAESYDRIAERHAEWAAAVRAEERARYTARVVQTLPRGATVLELGCGAGGRTTQTLATHFRVTGVDISPRSIALARHNVPSGHFLAADMTQAAFSPRSFDAVVAFYSIIHVPRDEQPALFVRIAQWLRPDGLFRATLTSCDTAADYESDWLGAAMYWSGFSPATTQRLIQAAGLTITSAAVETADEEGRPVSFLWVEARGPSQR